MKVTVCFDKTKVVVPCGDGNLLICELMTKAVLRYQAAIGKNALVKVEKLYLARDGGILDWNDRVHDVIDDKELIVAQMSDRFETQLRLHKRYTNSEDIESGFSTSSSPTLRNANDVSSVVRSVAKDEHMPYSRWASSPNIDIAFKASSSASRFEGRPNMTSSSSISTTREQSFRCNDAIANHHNISFNTQNSRPTSFESDEFNLFEERGAVFFIFIEHQPGTPLGITVKPVYHTSSSKIRCLQLQTVDCNSRAINEAKLRTGDRLLEVNGVSLNGVSFRRAQEVLQEAIHAPILKLRVQSFFTSQDNRNTNAVASESKLSIEDSVPLLFDTDLKPPSLPARLTKSSFISPLHEEHLTDEDVLESTKLAQLRDPNATNVRTIGHAFIVELIKGVDGLGFSVTSRDVDTSSTKPIYVKNILSNGAAIQDGRLRSGDRLLEVNGWNVVGKQQAEVVAQLRSIPQGDTVQLLVSRAISQQKTILADRDYLESSMPCFEAHLDGEDPKHILTLDIPLSDNSNASGLGVCVRTDTAEKGVFIKSIIAGSVAQKDGRLMDNDRLISINGQALDILSNEQAIEMLCKHMRTGNPVCDIVRLVVERRYASNNDTLNAMTNTIINAHVHEFAESCRDGAASYLHNDALKPLADSDMHFLEHKDNRPCVKLPSSPPFSSLLERVKRLESDNTSYYASTSLSQPLSYVGQTLEGAFINSSSDHSLHKNQSSTSLVAAHEIVQGPCQELSNTPQWRSTSFLMPDYCKFSSETPAIVFNREGLGRRSVSEKRHANIDAKQLPFYKQLQRSREEVDSSIIQQECQTLPNIRKNRGIQLHPLQTLSTPNLSSDDRTQRCTLYYARPIVLTDFSSSSPQLTTTISPTVPPTSKVSYQRRFIPLALKRNMGSRGAVANSNSRRLPWTRNSNKAVLNNVESSQDNAFRNSAIMLSDVDAQIQKSNDGDYDNNVICLRRTNNSFRKAVDYSYDDSSRGFNDVRKSLDEKKGSVKNKIIQRLHRLKWSPLKHSSSLDNSTLKTSTIEEQSINVSENPWTLPDTSKDRATDKTIERIYSSAESRVLAWQAQNAALCQDTSMNAATPTKSDHHLSFVERSHHHYNINISRASVW